MKIRLVSLVLFFISFGTCFCQENVDAKFLFKNYLFLEKGYIKNQKAFHVKGENLFYFFNHNTHLSLDTLRSYGFSNNYLFLKLSPKSGVSINESSFGSDSLVFLNIQDNCSEYVVGVDLSNGKSYRLKGFSANDFFALFQDVNKRLKGLNQSKKKIKIFIRDFSVDSVDFNCIYYALKSGGVDLDKFPCLKNCDIENISIE